ncbi:hypothetical protein F7Y47_23620, partial [Vibrio sp. 1-2-3a]|nr:hypothetical protein [Vibrio sp. 2-1-2a]MDU9605332.1 hypothetical protein [Vibrio sp. 1-2-3a]
MALSLRSSIAKRRSHLNAALAFKEENLKTVLLKITCLCLLLLSAQAFSSGLENINSAITS